MCVECESTKAGVYLLRCTCSRTAGGTVWWSCRRRWRPVASETPRTWCSWRRPVCSSGCRQLGRKCRQSCPCWETLPLQRCPVRQLNIKKQRVGMCEEDNRGGEWGQALGCCSFSPQAKSFKALHCFWGCTQRWCCLSLQLYRRKHPGQRVGCHWSSVAGNIPHWLQETITIRLQGRIRGRRKESWATLPSTCLTQRRAYLSVFNVVDLLLCLFSGGRWSLSSFRVLITSFWVLALADSWLLQWHNRRHAQQHVRYCTTIWGKNEDQEVRG